MARYRILVAILLLTLPLMTFAKREGKLEGLENPGAHAQPTWFKNSFLDLREDLEEASEEGKRVVLYFYQDGCPYCKKLLTLNFAQKAIVDKTRKNFEVIAINMWGDREVIDLQGESTTEKQFADNMRVMFTPTLLFLDEKGDQIVRVNGYYHPNKFMATLDYVASKQEKTLSFRDYLKTTSPNEPSGTLHSKTYFMPEPYTLQRQEGQRPLLVLFEQKDCPNCDEMHTDVLLRKETEDLIKRFDVVQLDMWSSTPVVTPNGEKTTADAWAKQLGIQYAPSFVFFDGGKEVFRMEAYLKAFHTQSSLDYVSTGAYLKQPSFQRYIDERANHLRDSGATIELMD